MKPPDSTLTSEVKQPERKRKKSISVPGVVYVLIYHCYGGAEDLFPQLMKALSEMLPLRFSWQVQISLMDIKAVMITLPRTRRRTTPGCHVPAVIAWQGPWIYGEQALVMSKPLHSNLLFMSFGTHWHTHGSRSRRRFDFHELLMLNQFMTDVKRLCWFRSCMCVLLILQNKRVKSSTIDLFSLYFSIFCSCNLRTDWFPLSCNRVFVLWLIGLS